MSTWCPKASQEFWVDLVLKKGTEKTSSMQSEHYSDVIIGSGPCGYAAAKSHIDLGHNPLVIDFGLIPQSENLNTERISKLVIKTAQERNSVFDYPEKLVTSVDTCTFRSQTLAEVCQRFGVPVFSSVNVPK